MWFKSNLPFVTLAQVVWTWALDLPIATASQMLEISEQTIVPWLACFCKVCPDKLVRGPYKIRGPGKVLEMDDSDVAHRKYEKGKIVPLPWVLGRCLC